MRIKYYLNLWKEYTRLNIETWTEYRLDFFIGIFSMFLSNITSILMFWAIYLNIIQINGWTFWQMVFLSGLVALAVGIWHAFFSGIAPWSFENYVRKGWFDRLLMQPANPFASLIASGLNRDGFGDLIAGLIITYVGASMSGIAFNLQNILLLVSMLSGGVLIFFSFMILACTTAFWTTKTHSIGDIVWSLIRFVDFPLEIYNPFIKFILTFVVPFGFINYYPAALFLGKGSYIAYLTPVIGIINFVIAYGFWKFGMKNYASTGS